MSNNHRLHLYRQPTIDGLSENGGLPPLSVVADVYSEINDEIIASAFSQNISGSNEVMTNDSQRDGIISSSHNVSGSDENIKSTQSTGKTGGGELADIEALPADSAPQANNEGDKQEEEEEEGDSLFHEFTRESYDKLIVAELERKQQEETRQVSKEEAHLVDGEIVFDDVEDDTPKIARDPKLADGQPLPEKLGRFPRELDGLPLEEIDPHIQEKTFVIISKKLKRYHIFRFSATRALFCLAPWNKLRKFCLTVISNQWFDWFILLTISINCLFMMIQPTNSICKLYAHPNGTTALTQSELMDNNTNSSSITCTNTVDYIKDVPENVFQSIYTVEMLLKITARGLILNKHTYLRDGWNWLDFIVVIIAYVTLIIEESTSGETDTNLTGVRAFRVLRALKSISAVPGLRTIVNAILKSMKMLGEVVLLILFCIAVFALLALQLYKGVLKQKCVLDIPTEFNYCNVTHPGSEFGPLCFNSAETLQNYWLLQSTNYLYDSEGEAVMCSLQATSEGDIASCPDGYFCAKAGDNPNWKFTHFDNFPWAMLNTFQLVSLDFWEDTYNKIILVDGPWNILFFLMVVLLGSFYLLNLMLAVVFMAYVQEADVEAKLAKEEEEEERAKEKRKQNTALLFDPKKLKAQLMQRQEEEARKLADDQAKHQTEIVPTVEISEDISPQQSPAKVMPNGRPFRPRITSSFSLPKFTNLPPPSSPGALSHEPIPETDAPQAPTQPAPEKVQIKRPKTGHGQFVKSKVMPADGHVTEGEVKQPVDCEMELTELEDSTENLQAITLTTEKGPTDPEDDEDLFYDDLPPMDRKTERYLVQKFATLWLNRIRSEDDKLIDRNCLCCAKSGIPSYHVWMKWQNLVFKVANDGLFELFITLCILVNTALMASEYYNACELCRLCVDNITSCTICADNCDLAVDSQREWLEGMTRPHAQALNIANIVFTVIFTVEAAIKLTALSKEYFNVGWNIFDLVIVCISLPDLVLQALQLEQEGLNEVAKIIKICRLLRIVKLAQSWSTMRTLLGIIFGAFGALLNLSIILVIIMFIFAVLGNQLLGHSYLKYEDLVNNPQLADYGGELPRWHFNGFFHSILMVFRILCGEWVEPLWDCMRVASEEGCTALFLVTLILGNFMIFNLFLALLLNSFSSEKFKKEKSEEGESKLKKSLRRIYHCFNSSSCCKKQSSSKQQSLLSESKLDTLHPEPLLDRKPSITINGSQKSALSLIEATNPKHDNHKNGSAFSVKDETKSSTDVSSFVSGGLELKPVMRNGHAKSRSGSVLSNLSNGTGNTSNGVLKNKSPDMSPYNLQQIESAFSTQRDQYAKFETAVNATSGGCHNPGSAPVVTPIIIAEDFSTSEKKKAVVIAENNEEFDEMQGPMTGCCACLFISDEGKGSDEEEDDENVKISKDGEDDMLADDGNIILPDCCCLICHKDPKLDGCCSSTWVSFRMVCAKIVTHKAFEGFILLLILASTIALCFEDIYLHEKPALKEALTYLNIIFAGLFFIEMLLKMFALGAKKYFTGFWSILDFVIVCVSITDVASGYVSDVNVSAFRAFRTLRALRPLRAVSRWESMTIIVNALIFAMPAIANVFLVCLVFWALFVIMGVQTFRGKFHSCQIDGEMVKVFKGNTSDCSAGVPLPSNLSELVNYKFPPTLVDCENKYLLSPLLGNDTALWHWARLCMLMGGEWNRFPIHFDNFLAGYLALYQTATFEGWMEVMQWGVDHNPDPGGQPDRELSLYWYIYFMGFIIFGAFFTLNLFIGVIIDNFNVLKKKYDGSYLAMFLTDGQRHYYNTLKKLGNKKPQKTIRRPKTKFQAFFFDVATNTKFELAITFVIFLNMIAMMIDYEPATIYGTMNVTGEFMPDREPPIDYAVLSATLDSLNIAFTVIFVVEAAIKIIGLRLHYFRRAWNVFDFVIVLLSVLGIIIDTMFGGSAFISPTLLRVVRVFRIGRVIRLVKAAKGLRKLLFALIISVPALFNIATLLFLFMFIFAVVGMTFFMHVRHKDALDETVNFETFGRSMILLFRLSTSGGWNDVLYPLMDETDCNTTHYIDSLGVPQPNPGGDCGDVSIAVAFFLFYLFATFMIIINMYIAVILENFNQAHEQEEIGITEDDFDAFYVIWEKYDPHATQYIKLEYIPDFLSELDSPLGVQKPNGMAIVAFNLPIVEGDRIHCLDVLMALVKRVLVHSGDEDQTKMSEEHRDANEKLKQQIADKYKSAFPQRQNVKVVSTTMQRKKEDVAAKTLQRAWRKHKMKQNILRIKELALETQTESRRPSGTFANIKESIKERLGSALSRFSLRRASTRSVDSRDGLSPKGKLHA